MLPLVGFSLFFNFFFSFYCPRSPATGIFHHHKVSALLLIFSCIIIFHSPCFPLMCFLPKGNQSPHPSWKRMFCFYQEKCKAFTQPNDLLAEYRKRFLEHSETLSQRIMRYINPNPYTSTKRDLFPKKHWSTSGMAVCAFPYHRYTEKLNIRFPRHCSLMWCPVWIALSSPTPRFLYPPLAAVWSILSSHSS